jgi:hypothetical protein
MTTTSRARKPIELARMHRERIRSGAALLFCWGCAAATSPSVAYIPTEPGDMAADSDTGEWSKITEQCGVPGYRSSIICLRAAPQARFALSLVQHFFDAVASGDARRIRSLLDSSAVVFDARGRERPFDAAWSERLRKFDYRKTLGVRVFWLPHVTVAARVTVLPAPLRAAPDEIIVVVPIETTQIDGQRLFGQQLWFRMRQSERGLKITGCWEDFTAE